MKTDFLEVFDRDLKKIKDRRVRQRVQDAIAEVEAATTLFQVRHLEKIAGRDKAFRIRVGDYRLGVFLEGDTVEFARCLPRRDIYRKFP